MVAAYVVLTREAPVRDAAEMAEYQRMNREKKSTVARPEPIVVYGALEALEGEKPDGCIILKFESMEDAKAWYYDPAYQASVVHRHAAADYRAFIVQGV